MSNKRRAHRLAAASSLCIAFTQLFPSAYATEPTAPQTLTGGVSTTAGLTVLSAQDIKNLAVPKGQTVAIDFGSLSTLNLKTNLTNAGTIYVYTSNPTVTTAKLVAPNITNGLGALISTSLPLTGIPGVTQGYYDLNLVLQALHNITNYGTISSAGNLSVIAGGTITNSLAAGMRGPSPVMQAMANLNLQASTIVNSGVLASQLANINAVTSTLNNHGLMKAACGNIDIKGILNGTLNINNVRGEIVCRDNIVMEALANLNNDCPIVNKAVLSVLGGSLKAGKNILANAPNGGIRIECDTISGQIFAKGSEATIGVNHGDLNICSLEMTGDPVIYNRYDNLVLTSSILGLGAQNPGQDFAFLSGANIVTDVRDERTFSTAGKVSADGDITLAAGVRFNTGTGKPGLFTIIGDSKSGGSILLSNISFKTDGKTIFAVANSGCDFPGAIKLGNLTTSSLQPGGAAGNVKVIADGQICLNNITAVGGNATVPGGAGGAGGDVLIQSCKAGASVCGDIITKGGNGKDGTSYPRSNRSNGGNGGNGGAGGDIKIATLCDVTIKGDLLSQGGNGGNGGNGGTNRHGGNGGQGADSGNICLVSKGGSVYVCGDVKTKGGDGGNGGNGGPGDCPGGVGGLAGNGGDAGDINITAKGNVGVKSACAVGGDGGSGGNGGNGGPGGSRHAQGGVGGNGGAGGDGGSITITAYKGGIIAGSLTSEAGDGGNGGIGGNAARHYGYTYGGKGGNGGAGGCGDDIKLKANCDIDVVCASSLGGDGGNGGNGGNAADGKHDQTKAPTAANGGNGGNGGAGGGAGTIQLVALNGKAVLRGLVLSEGGDGGCGGNGGKGSPTGGNGGNGGDGGNGGNGGNITVTGKFGVDKTIIASRGGEGGQAGSGGQGGDCGNNGKPGCDGNDGKPGVVCVTAPCGDVKVIAGGTRQYDFCKDARGCDHKHGVCINNPPTKPPHNGGGGSGGGGGGSNTNTNTNSNNTNNNNANNNTGGSINNNNNTGGNTNTNSNTGGSVNTNVNPSTNTINVNNGVNVTAGLAGLVSSSVRSSTNSSTEVADAEVGQTSEDSVLPVAFITPLQTAAAIDMNTMKIVSSEHGVLKCSADAQVVEENGAQSLVSGEALAAPTSTMRIDLGNSFVVIPKGAIALINKKDGVTKVRNLFENSARSITMLVGGSSFKVAAGEEALVGSSRESLHESMAADQIGRRDIRHVAVKDLAVATCEVSIPALFQGDQLMKLVHGSNAKEDKSIFNKMMKMAACLMQITSNRGAYHQISSK